MSMLYIYNYQCHVKSSAATVNETQLDTCEPSEAMADHALHICDELNLSVAEGMRIYLYNYFNVM